MSKIFNISRQVPRKYTFRIFFGLFFRNSNFKAHLFLNSILSTIIVKSKMEWWKNSSKGLVYWYVKNFGHLSWKLSSVVEKLNGVILENGKNFKKIVWYRFVEHTNAQRLCTFNFFIKFEFGSYLGFYFDFFIF